MMIIKKQTTPTVAPIASELLSLLLSANIDGISVIIGVPVITEAEIIVGVPVITEVENVEVTIPLNELKADEVLESVETVEMAVDANLQIVGVLLLLTSEVPKATDVLETVGVSVVVEASKIDEILDKEETIYIYIKEFKIK